MSILDKINAPSDVKQLNIKELEELAQELRKEILDTTAKNGGHLASNLGIVETTVALYYTFPKIKSFSTLGINVTRINFYRVEKISFQLFARTTAFRVSPIKMKANTTRSGRGMRALLSRQG